GVTVRLLLVPWRAAYVDEAARQHPEAVAAFRAWMAEDPPLGAETGAPLGIGPTGFIDYGHLAETGAARFTAALAEQVRPLLR
ncbi:MAG: hypothetical protein KC620_24285, partial [Myxococcales bacterium]|nr:hypothetical protein [Myxococcales bacterium]